MEYRKSVLVIVAEDVKATIDLGKIEESFDVIAVSCMDEAREYINKVCSRICNPFYVIVIYCISITYTNSTNTIIVYHTFLTPLICRQLRFFNTKN